MGRAIATRPTIIRYILLILAPGALVALAKYVLALEAKSCRTYASNYINRTSGMSFSDYINQKLEQEGGDR